MMEKSELQQAIANIWKNLPVGAGHDFNKILKELEHLRNMLDSRCGM